MNLLDTIAAISTPMGKGGVAMIRISGSESINVARKIFSSVSTAPMPEWKHGTAHYGEISMPDGSPVDDGLATVFFAPHSFTGEDTVEICCHGGLLVTRQVLTAALRAGARQAEAGEFTRRAFMNGKISLSEAESLGYLLEAKSEEQLCLARGGMRGRLSEKTRRIYDLLCDVMTNICAAIDFPDEDLSELSREKITECIENALSETQSLAATYGTGRAVIEGIPTVICGRTNAGKSSVYNRIVGYEAAIVTDVEGTTRDVLREQTHFGKTTLLLCDTAGIRNTEDKVESIGISRAFDEMQNAELILAVFDGSLPLCEDELSLIDRLKKSSASCIALINKTDLSTNADTERFLKSSFVHCVKICAKSGEGFDSLCRIVNSLFIDGRIDMNNDAVVTGARQYAALSHACDRLSSALEELNTGTPLDLCCIEIRSAMSAVGEVDGREIDEDIVSEIFSKFCVGK